MTIEQANKASVSLDTLKAYNRFETANPGDGCASKRSSLEAGHVFIFLAFCRQTVKTTYKIPNKRCGVGDKYAVSRWSVQVCVVKHVPRPTRVVMGSKKKENQRGDPVGTRERMNG